MIRQIPLVFIFVLLAYPEYSLARSSSSDGLEQQEKTDNTSFLRGGQEQRHLDETKCGCDSCTADVLNADADGYSCGGRINWVFENTDRSETEACALVAGEEFPEVCGGCDPNRCSTTDDNDKEEEGLCGCSTCTETVWNTLAGDYTCGARITWLEAQSPETLLGLGITNGPLDEAGACRAVSEEFPEICTCNPDICNGSAPTEPPTEFPTPKPTEAPTTKAPVLAPDPPTDEPMCGCDSCVQKVLDRNAGGYSCGGRINWLVKNSGSSERNACLAVGGKEFPYICGACDPDTCNNRPTYSVAHFGNSIQYYNDAPRVLEKMLLSSTVGRIVDLDLPDRKKLVESESCLRGGSNIASLWDAGNGMGSKFAQRPQSIIPGEGTYDVGAPTVQDLLRQHWDFVVINDHTQHPVRSSRKEQSKIALNNQYLPAIANALKTASNSDATTTVVFLQTFAYRTPVKNSADLGSFDDFTNKLQQGYGEYVELVEAYDDSRIRATVAPLGRAYQIVRDEYYDLWNTALYAYDDFHPSPHGTWLEACLLHCTITGEKFAFFDDDIESFWKYARRLQNQRLPTLAEAGFLNDIAYRACVERKDIE